MNSSADNSAAARRVIAGGVVWEGCVGWTVECLPFTDGVLQKYRDAGFNHVSLTIAAEWNGVESTMRHLGRVRNWLAAQSDPITIISTADDIDAARAAGKLAVSFNFQGNGPFANDPNLIEIYARLGVRIVILNSNSRDAAWDRLARTLNGPVVRPWDNGFLGIAPPKNLRYATRMPAGITRCADSADVAAALRSPRQPMVDARFRRLDHVRRRRNNFPQPRLAGGILRRHAWPGDARGLPELHRSRAD